MNLYTTFMTSLELDRCYPTLERVLEPLGHAIASADNALSDKNLTDLHPHHVEAIEDKETWIIENLLGAAFITCQTHISLVVSTVMGLHACVRKNSTAPLSCCGDNKASVLSLGSPLVGHSGYTAVQVIDAAANYFKHRAEWDPEWKKLNTLQQMTADVLTAIGATPGSSGNMRTVAEVLGNPRFSKTSAFVSTVMGWHHAVEEAHRNELRTMRLI